MTSSALEKRIKKHIHAQPHEVRIMPAPGWQEICSDEVRGILESFTQPGKFLARLQDDPEGIGIANLDFRQLLEIPQRLLTAQACYWKILDRHVGSFGELHQTLTAMDWELYFPSAASLELKVQSFQSHLYHEGKLHESICAVLQEQGLKIKNEAPFHLLAEQRGNRLRLYLALGPYPLHHRQYKAAARHGAPLQECLAASALRWTMSLQKEWRPDQIVVPFAGSGTLLFESWLLLGQLPAYLWNPSQYLEQFPATPQASLQSIRKRLLEQTGDLPPAQLIEKDTEIFQNLSSHLTSFQKPLATPAQAAVANDDIFLSPLPESKRILAPLNPPYGLRLAQEGKSRPADFYRQLGAFLRQWPTKGQDLRGFVLIPDEDSLQVMRQELGSTAIQGIQSFSQGGQHIRCMAFRIG